MKKTYEKPLLKGEKVFTKPTHACCKVQGQGSACQKPAAQGMPSSNS